MASRIVLFVDESPAYARRMAQGLAPYPDVVTLSTSSGEGAFRALESVTPDLVVVSDQLSDTRGCDFVRALRRRGGPHIHVIAASDCRFPGCIETARAVGACHFVEKGIANRLRAPDLAMRVLRSTEELPFEALLLVGGQKKAGLLKLLAFAFTGALAAFNTHAVLDILQWFDTALNDWFGHGI